MHRAKAVKEKNPTAFAAVKAGTMSLAEAEADEVLDGEGNAVTREALQPIFRTRAKLVEAARFLSRAKAIIKEAIGMPGGEHIVPAETTIRIGATRERIAEHMPHVPCPSCEGVHSESCEKCTSRGWVTKSEASDGAGGEP